MKTFSYVLVTPARNEAAFIEKTILSVLAQTVLPEKWIIVNDGSTDATGRIVEAYAKNNGLLEHITVSGDASRNFGSKVRAFMTGYDKLAGRHYDFIGNLDGDVSFEPNYFEMIIKEFHDHEKLGLAGGVILDFYSDRFIKQKISLNSVAGAVQLFRKKCFDDIGGYIPLQYGCVDTYAEVMARMKGWEVRTLPDVLVFHHKPVNKARGNMIRSSVLRGIKDYMIGYHMVFYVLRCLSKLRSRPVVIGGMLAMLGYFWAGINKKEGDVPKEFLDYYKKEQLERLTAIMGKYNFLKSF